MINVIVPVVDKVEGYQNFFKQTQSADIKFFVGIKRSLAKELTLTNQMEVHVFDDNVKKEEIINALHSCKLIEGKIMIARRPLSLEEFYALSQSQSDITTLKAKHGKLRTWLKNLAKSIIKKFFAFTYFEDISAICYGEDMFELICVCPNISMASRVNKYVGVSIEEIETAQKPVNKEYNKPWTIGKLTLWSLFAIASIVGGIMVFLFAKVTVIVAMLVILWYVVAIMLWFVGLINFARTLSVGDLRFAKAQEVYVEQPEKPTFQFVGNEPLNAEKAKPTKTPKTSSKTQNKSKVSQTTKTAKQGETKNKAKTVSTNTSSKNAKVQKNKATLTENNLETTKAAATSAKQTNKTTATKKTSTKGATNKADEQKTAAKSGYKAVTKTAASKSTSKAKTSNSSAKSSSTKTSAKKRQTRHLQKLKAN